MHNELLIEWLNDAYATEEAQIAMLENHARDARDFPEVRARLLHHIDESRHHAQQIRSCLQRFGARPASVKSGLNRLMSQIREWATGNDEDELVKNTLADIAAERFEIASYQTIITAARDIGDHQTAEICEDILRDEQEMAQWLEEQLPGMVLSVFHAYASAHQT